MYNMVSSLTWPWHNLHNWSSWTIEPNISKIVNNDRFYQITSSRHFGTVWKPPKMYRRYIICFARNVEWGIITWVKKKERNYCPLWTNKGQINSLFPWGKWGKYRVYLVPSEWRRTIISLFFWTHVIITLLSLILIRFHGAGNNAIHYFPRGFIMNIISRATY